MQNVFPLFHNSDLILCRRKRHPRLDAHIRRIGLWSVPNAKIRHLRITDTNIVSVIGRFQRDLTAHILQNDGVIVIKIMPQIQYRAVFEFKRRKRSVKEARRSEANSLAFEQAIHKQCGQAEMADQMVGIRMLLDLPYVDADRIGVHGWSYGGFMTISLMTNYPDVFKVGVSGGPVIDWKWYEVMYGERYMDHPDVNPDGYAKTSLINSAKNLKGKLLICQGAIDPVVLWQHSLSFVRECVVNNIQVDYFPYPRHEHNVTGRDRVHLHDKISMYFEDYL